MDMLDSLSDATVAALTTGAVAILASVLSSLATIFAVFLTNRGNLNRMKAELDAKFEQDEKLVKRRKLEELYLLVDHWNATFQTIAMHTIALADGELTEDEAKSEIMEHLKTIPNEYARLEMIVEFDFPELAPLLKECQTATTFVVRLMNQHVREYRNQQVADEKHAMAAKGACNRFDAGFSTLKGGIAELARRI